METVFLLSFCVDGEDGGGILDPNIVAYLPQYTSLWHARQFVLWIARRTSVPNLIQFAQLHLLCLRSPLILSAH
jgi:hypothetical protein